jgi:hypothetical protein
VSVKRGNTGDAGEKKGGEVGEVNALPHAESWSRAPLVGSGDAIVICVGG